MVAQICWMLAKRHCDGVNRRNQLVEKGKKQAKMSMEYTSSSPGYEYARRQSEEILRILAP